jgi:putative FmdB family regulatory protein
LNNELGGWGVMTSPSIPQEYMKYEYKCQKHGTFEIKQSLFEEHKADCPECGLTAQRIYANLQWIWAYSVYRPDGSRREDKDYAPIYK